MEHDKGKRLSFNVFFTETCLKQYQKLGRSLGNSVEWKRIGKRIDEIGFDPTVGELLTGVLSGLRSVHAGDYRIIYKYLKEAMEIQVWAVGHRNKVYEDLMRYLKATDGESLKTIPSALSAPDN